MIELTDQMRRAYAHAKADARGWNWYDLDASDEAGLAAVLAIVERDQAGPCSVTLPRLTEYGDLWCQLRHGHHGDHEMGPTRWKERAT